MIKSSPRTLSFQDEFASPLPFPNIEVIDDCGCCPCWMVAAWLFFWTCVARTAMGRRAARKVG